MKRVVICGSARFHQQMADWSTQLSELGAQADAPERHMPVQQFDALAEEQQRQIRLELAEAHHALIDQADVVFIFNPKGYIGNSVTLEIGYALGKNKPVYALEPDAEQGRDVLFSGYCTTPNEIISKL